MRFQLPTCVSWRTSRFASVALFSAVLLSAVLSAQTAPAKVVGTVKSVTGSSVVLTTDSGTEVTVNFAANARIVRAAPGQSDLKSATPIQISEIQVGDRVATRGQPGEGNSILAAAAIVMKGSDIAQRQQQEREEWRRGVGGIVKEVNPAAGTITIANSLAAGGKPIQIHASPEATIRRYSPDSVKFDDAKPGTLDQIKPGDQVRARGTKNADGTEFTAQAIISGTFRDIAGTVSSTNAADNSMTITDLATKKPIVVKIGPDSMVRRLPQMMAMGIAMRLKGGAMGAGSPAAPAGAMGQGGNGGRQWQGNGAQAGAASGGPGAGRMGGGNFRGGPPDFQQMLARMPAVPISELNKGDAVILVATEGSAGSEPTAITLLAGVEPILSAAPAGTSAAQTILSPWNLGTEPAGAAGEAQ